MNYQPFITCAVTGSGDTADKHPNLPITPKQIADAAIEAAKAGAAIAHIHVRNPKNGKGVRGPELYPEVVEHIRKSKVDVILNFTSGMGGDIYFGSVENPVPLDPQTDMVGARERMRHVYECKPEITTLDCGSLNFGDGNYITCHTPPILRQMAKNCLELGVKPEMEVFDSGNLWLADNMVKEGLIENNPMIQLCMGIPYGAPADINTFMAMVGRMPKGAIWSSFAISRLQLPWVGLTVLAGGNIRVGLEDNLYLAKGQFASNGQLVTRAKNIVENMGGAVLNPAQTRELLQLKKQW